MDNTISIMHSSDVEVVTLEEHEGQELSQTLLHINSAIEMEPGHSFNSCSEPAGRSTSEIASASAMSQSCTVCSVSAHALDCSPGALGGENGSCGVMQNMPFEEGPAGKSAHARDKQFSSSPNDEASCAIRSQHKPCK